MQIELGSGAVKLGPNQTLKVVDAVGATLCALEGALWITEENQANDIVLEPGNCYRLQHPGTTLVNSLGGAAAVSLS
ncbi:MAG TPA: DUF2917 domain-containing protein [Burkholderiales bacterium]|jgi:hypothetical protein